MSARIAAIRLPLFDVRLGRSRCRAGDQQSVAVISAGIAIDFAKATRRERPDELPNLSRWHAQLAARPS
ncbi:MAG: hypothetical protein V2I63_05005 [Pseudomonadales bacterium]|nr:hypothetical protein [Pseudomonadales bacterium]